MKIKILLICLLQCFVFSHLFAVTDIQFRILHKTYSDLGIIRKDLDSTYSQLLCSASSNFTDKLSQDNKLAQLFHVSFPNKTYLFEREGLPAAGGFLFFGFNISSNPEELIRQNIEINNFYRKSAQIPPFYSLDCEGGLINRLNSVITTFPSARTISSKLSQEQSSLFFSSIAKQIKLCGFHINLAPVIEPLNTYNLEYLGNRSYGSYNDVITFGGSFVNSLLNEGIYPVVKHFPGNTNSDPHLGLPLLDIDLSEYSDLYIQIFSEFLHDNDIGVLAAHTVVPSIDTKPVCLSEKHLSYLKGISPYSDSLLIFSDDLLMSALTKNGYPPEESVVLAIESGVDLVMLSQARWEQYLALLSARACLDTNLQSRINESCRKIISWKCRMGILDMKVSNFNNVLTSEITIPKPLSDDEISKYCDIMVELLENEKEYGDTLFKRFF